jgi:signal transduction histidine kinase
VDGVRASGLEVHLSVDAGGPLPAAVELAAYRIVQEALTNVTRHAQASCVTVRIEHGDDVVIEIVDDGIGSLAGAGSGIAGMRGRAAALGGVVQAGSAPGVGFRVIAKLPVER